MKFKFLVLFFGVFLLSGCKVVCEAQKVVSSNLSMAIAKGLNCTNQPQIQADIDSVLAKTNVCSSKKEAGTIAMIVCPIVAQASVAYLGSKIPVSWGCDAAGAQQTMSGVITMFCNLLPF